MLLETVTNQISLMRSSNAHSTFQMFGKISVFYRVMDDLFEVRGTDPDWYLGVFRNAEDAAVKVMVNQ